MSTAIDGINDLRAGGTLAQSLPGYTERPAQIELASLVATSLTEKKHVVAEAGTGTGKSLGYLLPIVRSGKVAIVSTANKALQEQLFYKDIPFVQQHVQPFKAALMKGFSNYVCLDRLEQYRTGFMDEPTAEMIEQVAQLVDGDFEKLDEAISSDLKSEIQGDRDQCAWKKCRFYEDCHIRKMRAFAKEAQVIVVNHHLLLLDALAGGKVLPEHEIVVIDEAHHLEETATGVFTIEVKASSIQALLSHMTVRARVKKEVLDEAARQLSTVWQRLDALFTTGRILSSPVEEGLRLSTIIGDIARTLKSQPPTGNTEQDEVLYSKLVTRAENLREHLRTVFSVANTKQFVYYLERSGFGRRTRIEAKAAPLDVAPFLREHLFAKHPTICTSATLATASDETGLSYFRRRVGLDDAQERILPLVFDYAENALLYLPATVPEPAYSGEAECAYQESIADEMLHLVQAARGRAFLLFSSNKALEATYSAIASKITYPVLKQGEMPRAKLTEQFRSRPNAVLFGLKSFWEGVDIAGEALSLVVIDKLPFTPPDDPIQQARVTLLKEAGENWFGGYVLPQAVLHLKQGVGRLIRTSEDRGVMAILDARLHTKGYGRRVLSALPPARRTASTLAVAFFFETAEQGASLQAPCMTLYDRLQAEPHRAGSNITRDVCGNAWCERCEVQRLFMNAGQRNDYPAILQTGRTCVAAGEKNYLRYARIAGHRYIQVALQLTGHRKQSA